MIYCPRCRHGNPDGAKFCEQCGCTLQYGNLTGQYTNSSANYYGQSIQNTTHNKSKRGYGVIAAIAFVVIAVILVLSIGAPKNSHQEMKSKSESEILTETLTTISIGDLLQAYSDNEVNADNLYTGKTLKISGIVDSVSKDVFDHTYVKVITGEPYEIWGAQCYIKSSEMEDAAELKPGDTITVVGLCEGYSLNVVFKDCEIY